MGGERIAVPPIDDSELRVRYLGFEAARHGEVIAVRGTMDGESQVFFKYREPGVSVSATLNRFRLDNSEVQDAHLLDEEVIERGFQRAVDEVDARNINISDWYTD